MAEVTVVARYKVSQTQVDEVMALITEHVRATLAEPGCRSCEVYQRVDDARYVVLMSRYVSPEALAEHRASDHFKNYLVNGVGRRVDSRTVHTIESGRAAGGT
jgi:quinol monooxygenase YgiN